MQHQRKKILILSDYLSGTGGVEQLLRLYARVFAERYEVHVVGFYIRDIHRADLPRTVIRYWYSTIPGIENRVYRAPKSRILMRLLPMRLRKKYDPETLSFDAVLCLKESDVLAYALRFPAQTHLAWIHSDFSRDHYSAAFYASNEEERAMLAQFSRVVCVSEKLKASLRNEIGDPGNIVVRYNPIPVDEIRKKASAPLPASLARHTDMVRFVMIGRLDVQKGYDLLIAACRLLREKGVSRYEVLVAGEESPAPGGKHTNGLRKELEEQLQRAGVSTVRFLGALENPYPLLASADYFLSTSRYEGQSLAMQEAAVLGIPAILTDCAGVREFTDDGKACTLVNIDVKEIAAVMRDAIEHPEKHPARAAHMARCAEKLDFSGRLGAIEELFYGKNNIVL